MRMLDIRPLRDVSITSYESGLASSVFLHFLSHCPLLAGIKTTFFGQIILEKTSSRQCSTLSLVELRRCSALIG